LAAAAALGIVAQISSREALEDLEGFGAYPLGLLAVALLLVTSRRDTAVVALAGAASTALAMGVVGQSAIESVTYGLGGALAALAVLPLLRRPGGALTLRSETDLLRLLAAVAVGTAVLGVAVTAGGALAG